MRRSASERMSWQLLAVRLAQVRKENSSLAVHFTNTVQRRCYYIQSNYHFIKVIFNEIDRLFLQLKQNVTNKSTKSQ